MQEQGRQFAQPGQLGKAQAIERQYAAERLLPDLNGNTMAPQKMAQALAAKPVHGIRVARYTFGAEPASAST